jgi:hypothetical protein
MCVRCPPFEYTGQNILLWGEQPLASFRSNYIEQPLDRSRALYPSANRRNVRFSKGSAHFVSSIRLSRDLVLVSELTHAQRVKCLISIRRAFYHVLNMSASKWLSNLLLDPKNCFTGTFVVSVAKRIASFRAGRRISSVRLICVIAWMPLTASIRHAVLYIGTTNNCVVWSQAQSAAYDDRRRFVLRGVRVSLAFSALFSLSNAAPALSSFPPGWAGRGVRFLLLIVCRVRSWLSAMLNFALYLAFLLYTHYMRENVRSPELSQSHDPFTGLSQAERRLYTLREQLKVQFKAAQKAQINERIAADSKRRLTS